ncbi:AAA family ATPase [Pseudomonas asplenii]|uniref:AAA family ATPase n=1 Tax=Pseudomonas asplenii TaxID=53407 RepID=UPI000A6F3B15|nr:AAA family ATPase [Pseudomonas asplenii]
MADLDIVGAATFCGSWLAGDSARTVAQELETKNNSTFMDAPFKVSDFSRECHLAFRLSGRRVLQKFDRGAVPPPLHLKSEEAKLARARLLEFFSNTDEKILQSNLPALGIQLTYLSVKKCLEELFNRKCAFCESVCTTVPYRFRPASNAIPVENHDNAHLYYSWLENAWENIYSICTDCIPDRSDYFPVIGRRAPVPTRNEFDFYVKSGSGQWGAYPPEEENLLLDPCASVNFSKHFEVDLSGELIPISEHARETIQNFKLNRPNLVRKRGEVLKGYLQRYEATKSHGSAYEQSDLIFNFPHIEFGGVWLIYLEQEQARSLGNLAVETFFQPGTTNNRLFTALNKYKPVVDVTNLPRFPEPEYRTRQLKSIELRNFKSIERLVIDMPENPEQLSEGTTPALLILGENAAGKSSILEAVALAMCSKPARNELALDVHALPLNPELLGSSLPEKVAPAFIKLSFRDSTTRTLGISSGRYRVGGEEHLPSVFAYGAFRQYQEEDLPPAEVRPIINLFKSHVLLSNPEKWLLGLREPEFRMVVRALREILSIEAEFDVMDRDFSSQQCFLVSKLAGTERKSRTPLSLASSGYRAVLAMVCDVMQGLMNKKSNMYFQTLVSASAVVLIDEVEAHLHPRWKIQIMQALRKALPKVTFIATTHDPLCLRGMHNGEVVVMQRIACHDKALSEFPVYVERITELPNVAQLTIEQLLTSDFFNLSSTDQPDTERELAKFADLLSAREKGEQLTQVEQDALHGLERDISSALPVGSTEVQRLVQEAVVEYLDNRRLASAQKLSQLRSKAKQDILDILNGL